MNRWIICVALVVMIGFSQEGTSMPWMKKFEMKLEDLKDELKFGLVESSGWEASGFAPREFNVWEHGNGKRGQWKSWVAGKVKEEVPLFFEMLERDDAKN